MGKPGAFRQKEYENRRKDNDKEAYLKKRREQKQKQRASIKANKEKYEAYKRKDRMRKKKDDSAASSPLNSSFATRQSLGKAVIRTVKSLPKTPFKKKEVLTQIVSNLSPSTKKEVFTSARRQLDTNAGGRPSISKELRDTIVAFLERPNISYCKPGRQDTAYCGKNAHGEKQYRSQHYLLWTLKEIVTMFNAEHENIISYHTVQKIVKEEKHLLTATLKTKVLL